MVPVVAGTQRSTRVSIHTSMVGSNFGTVPSQWPMPPISLPRMGEEPIQAAMVLPPGTLPCPAVRSAWRTLTISSGGVPRPVPLAKIIAEHAEEESP